MNAKDIHILKLRIENLIARIDRLILQKRRDDETISDLTKLLCITVSSYIEKSFVVIIKEYSTKRSCVEIQNYIAQALNGTTNLKMDRIVKIVRSFNNDWADTIESDSRFTEYDDSLAFIVSNRNVIAHGGNSGVTVRDLKTHYSVICDFIDELKTIYTVYV
jgi:hypothetical protein